LGYNFIKAKEGISGYIIVDNEKRPIISRSFSLHTRCTLWAKLMPYSTLFQRIEGYLGAEGGSRTRTVLQALAFDYSPAAHSLTTASDYDTNTSP